MFGAEGEGFERINIACPRAVLNQALEQLRKAAKTYVNIIAVKEGNEQNDAIVALVNALKSDEIKQYITDTYDGAVIFYEK